MEPLTNLPQGLWWRIIVTGILCLASVTFYRLFLHPLAKFPGPKLAAVTRWYEAYYDVVENGQYTFKIEKMHKQYGPIVRISPHELHVSDPDFLETLYRHDGRWDKYAWAVDAFAAHGATLFTTGHDLHRIRRQPLNPFFSKSKVASRHGLIQRHLDILCSRLSEFAASRKMVNLGAATTALTRDVANDFIINKSYKSLEQEDFDIAQLIASQGGGWMWRVTKHQNMADTKDLMMAAKQNSSAESVKNERTIVHEILDSKLPPSEKTFKRIFEDVSTVLGAGFETTASALRVIFVNLFSNEEILQRLRAELDSNGSTSDDHLDLKRLEQLPYLTSILMEGLRLSPALATRLARIAPDRDLLYGKWRIPAGTPVGMTAILMHTDEKVYSDPQRFAPDRWVDPEARKKAEKAFAPFSRGTRMCLGMYLAWAEMYMTVATLAQRFDFQLVDATPEDFLCMSDQFTPGVKAQGSLKAVISNHGG